MTQQILSLKCPHCDAPQDQPAADAGGQCQCTFCGTRFSVLPPALPVRPVAPAAAPAAAAPTPASRFRAALVVIVLVAALFGLLLLRVSTRFRGPSTPSSRSSSSSVYVPATAPRPPEVTPTAEFTYHRSVRSYSTVYVYGVVKNTCTVPIDKVKVIVVLRDAAGRELTTRSGYAERELFPGESSPVQVLLANPPAFAGLAFETAPRKTYVAPRRAAGLRLETQPPERNVINSLVFRGKVHNEGTTAARFVRVLVTALDAEGKIVGLAYGYAEGERLASWTAARYEVSGHFPQEPVKFELSVEGRPLD